ncbi:hypothetical protein [Corynebacterium parakroppenstedtii]|uniref:hypothetical protein n=1 Tax=Corynebacterium parakroppenstedtii TaxID=2828363 RepID=UPI001C8F9C67|nr:hypothetical protein [Corynebacterium parakroppenstedtii]MBY0794100.1 hypothetical protein [Corynebacterium parakroppenstedtii]
MSEISMVKGELKPMGDMTRSRKYISLLSVIPVVCLCLPGCDQRNDETSQGSPSAVSPSAASPSSLRDTSNNHANIQPSLDSQAETDRHTDGDATESDRRRQEDAPSTLNGTSNYIPNPNQIGGYCGTTYDGDEIKAEATTSCGFAGAIFTSAMQQTYSKWAPDPTVTPIMRAGFTQKSPTTGQEYTVVCIISTAQDTLSCREKISATGNDYGSFKVDYHRGPAGIFGPRVSKE